jgi:hypothetical protein
MDRRVVPSFSQAGKENTSDEEAASDARAIA